MSNGQNRATAKGSTRTDLRLTRAPADTPRGKLHQLAARCFRAGHEAKRLAKLDLDDVAKLRDFAKRGLIELEKDQSRGARMILYLCRGLEAALGPLALLDVASVVEIAEGLTTTLVQLEVAETTIRELQSMLVSAERDAQFERGQSTQLRALLSQAQGVIARHEASQQESEHWSADVRTRKHELTAEEKRVITDPDEP